MNFERTPRLSWSTHRFMEAIALFALFLGGCATSMSKIPDSSQPLTASEGTVVGSVLVRVGNTNISLPFPVSASLLRPARSIGYSLEMGVARDIKSIMEKPIAFEKRFLLNIEPDQEKIFVTRMPAGPHVFDRLVPRGYEEAAALLGISFSVAPGATTYIGRVIFDLPEKLPLLLPQGFYSLKFTIQVEDAQEATIDSIRSTHGRIVENVVKDLMRAE